jgi:aryl-alcohol dehydrogenase-like predicted oxidoreductase
VTSAIAGARRPHQIQQTAEAVDLALSPEIVSRLTKATEAVKLAIGPNPDMWQTASRFR